MREFLSKITVLKKSVSFFRQKKRRVQARIDLVKIYYYDYCKYVKYSYFSGINDKSELDSIEAEILFQLHRIEKGLSLPNMRPEFGYSSIEEIIKLSSRIETLGVILSSFKIYPYMSSLFKEYDRHYVEIGKKHGFELNRKFIEIKNSDSTIIKDAGVISVDRIENDINSYEQVLKSRYSTRAFKQGYVNDKQLKKAINLSIHTPSVCNRQHWRIHHYKGECKDKVLSLQNGNQSFREQISEVLLITSKVSYFRNPFERNQMYTDGGLFSMNLMNSMFYYGINSCPLNWSSSLEQNITLEKLKLIPKDEVVIMAIAIGYPSDKSKRTASTKLSLDNFYLEH